MKRVSVRELRETIGPLLDLVRQGEQVLVTRRGQPIARIIPEREVSGGDARHPLRGSVTFMADDFDEPIEGLWDALDG